MDCSLVGRAPCYKSAQFLLRITALGGHRFESCMGNKRSSLKTISRPIANGLIVLRLTIVISFVLIIDIQVKGCNLTRDYLKNICIIDERIFRSRSRLRLSDIVQAAAMRLFQSPFEVKRNLKSNCL